MDPSFWHERWRENRIAFHQTEINVHLQELWPEFGFGSGDRILVPMCGKSRDMLYLARQGHRVVGVEISPLAVRSFFEENQLSVRTAELGDMTVWQCGQIELWCGDFYRLDPSLLGPFAGAYDRASLIALPPPMRSSYAEKLASILPARSRALLICMEYDQSAMQGPPFAVYSDEVQSLLGRSFQVERVKTVDVLGENPRFEQQGLDQLYETIYRLKRLEEAR